jgi:hypothetical protein
MRSLVHARLPRGGLGNKLLVWARATVFGALNNLPVVTTGWADVRIGPLLRRERFKRYYFGYFRSQHPLQLLRLFCSYAVSSRTREPELQSREAASETLYVFRELPRYPNYFDGLRDYRGLIKDSLWNMTSPSVLGEALKSPPPVIGVHVRRSDFREQAPGELPGAETNVRTPSEHFIRSIRLVREIHGGDLGVTVYTDAHPEELRDLLTLGNVAISSSSNALYDLISLSRSRCLILSHGSTFGYWAGFLADVPVIVPYPLISPIRPAEINARYYEGVAQESALLVQNIKAIPQESVRAKRNQGSTR